MIGWRVFAVGALAAASAWADTPATGFVELDGAQIRSAIAGKFVTDEHHWSHRYYADGRLERSESRRRKTGRWSVQDNRLCLLLPEIEAKAPICYRVFRRGDELEYRDERYVVYRGTVQPMPK